MSRPDRRQPVRTCIGCRARGPKAEFVRVVAVDGVAVVDQRKVLAGRGAYLHPTAECLAAATKRRAFGRALRADADPRGVGDLVDGRHPSTLPAPSGPTSRGA